MVFLIVKHFITAWISIIEELYILQCCAVNKTKVIEYLVHNGLLQLNEVKKNIYLYYLRWFINE